jgi:hypothetical protein
MPVAFSLFIFDNYAVEPNDISFGEAETKEIKESNGSSGWKRIRVVRPSITITIRGISVGEASSYIAQSSQGGSATRTITVAGKTIQSAKLKSAKPSAPISIAENEVLDSLELLYESDSFTDPKLLYETFDGYPVDPNKVNFSDGDTKEIAYRDGNKLSKIKASRRQVSITLEGVPDAAVSQYSTARHAYPQTTRTITLAGRTLPECKLISLSHTGLNIAGEGRRLVESLTLTYETKDYLPGIEFGLFEGYPVEPGDISFSHVEGETFDRAKGSGFAKYRLTKLKLSVTLKGVALPDVAKFDSRLTGSQSPKNLSVAGRNARNMVLVNVSPSGVTVVNGRNIVDSLRLDYESENWQQDITYETFGGHPVNRNDIQFGESDLEEYEKVDSLRFKKISARRYTLEITLRGVPDGFEAQYVSQLQTLQTAQTISIAGRTMEAFLTNASPGPVVNFNGNRIRDLTLSYESASLSPEITYETFDGIPIKPGDIKFSYTTKVVSYNDGVQRDITLRKPKVAITMRGISPSISTPYIAQLLQDPLNPTKRNITINGRTISDAILVDAQPGSIIAIGGEQIMSELTLEYEAYDFDGAGGFLNSGGSNKFDGYEIGGISVGVAETETVEKAVNRNVNSAKLVRRSVSITLNAVDASAVRGYLSEAESNTSSLRTRNPSGSTISVFGVSFRNMLLVNASPSGAGTKIGTKTIIGGVTLTYEGREWL